MSDQHKAITDLSDLLDQVKSKINTVETELAYNDDRGEHDFREKLSTKTEKIELVRTSLEALRLKLHQPFREVRGRGATGTSNDSGYNSAPIERRHALLVSDEDLPQTGRHSLIASVDSLPTSSENHCSRCLQHIKSPTQVSEESLRNPCVQEDRISTEHEDHSEC
ncbi:uncharacterized protein [Argopecten irradians]|uniref:uncharacterized protein n=1 Tax=Argopecten irradians TaxID=31199 RepID=UPI003719C2B9